MSLLSLEVFIFNTSIGISEATSFTEFRSWIFGVQSFSVFHKLNKINFDLPSLLFSFTMYRLPCLVVWKWHTLLDGKLYVVLLLSGKPQGRLPGDFYSLAFLGL